MKKLDKKTEDKLWLIVETMWRIAFVLVPCVILTLAVVCWVRYADTPSVGSLIDGITCTIGGTMMAVVSSCGLLLTMDTDK